MIAKLLYINCGYYTGVAYIQIGDVVLTLNLATPTYKEGLCVCNGEEWLIYSELGANISHYDYLMFNFLKYFHNWFNDNFDKIYED
jgi:hypothetical protein